jgi:hypothetical protein
MRHLNRQLRCNFPDAAAQISQSFLSLLIGGNTLRRFPTNTLKRAELYSQLGVEYYEHIFQLCDYIQIYNFNLIYNKIMLYYGFCDF